MRLISLNLFPKVVNSSLALRGSLLQRNSLCALLRLVTKVDSFHMQKSSFQHVQFSDQLVKATVSPASFTQGIYDCCDKGEVCDEVASRKAK
jgi:hypothetical protein